MNQSENKPENSTHQIARQAIRQALITSQKDLLVTMSFLIEEEKRKLETANLKINKEE